MLAEIADGIPRRFPFHYATFLFEGFPVHGISPPPASGRAWPDFAPALRGDAVPGVLLTSQWWTTRRQIALSATVPVDAPKQHDLKVPAPSTDVLGRLKLLGNAKKDAPLVGLIADETMRPDTTILAETCARWDRALPATLANLNLPHSLPDEPPQYQGSGITSPHKDELVSVLKPRAYRANPAGSGHGIYLLTKTTNRGNRLNLCVDVGSWSHLFSAFLELKGLGWRTAFHLAVSPTRIQQYPISSQEMWRQVVENLAVVVDRAEATAVADVEALVPPAPAWFGAAHS